MTDLLEAQISCPYCAEHLLILIDPFEREQEFIEDCQVCCRPIVMLVDAELNVAVRTEDDAHFE